MVTTEKTIGDVDIFNIREGNVLSIELCNCIQEIIVKHEHLEETEVQRNIDIVLNTVTSIEFETQMSIVLLTRLVRITTLNALESRMKIIVDN